MKVLVCGGRDFADRDFVAKTLDGIARKHFDDNGGRTDGVGNWLPLRSFEVVHGDCKSGVDRFVDEWCTTNLVSATACPADWDEYGAAAGPIRNQRMLDDHRPDLVVAFPGGRGTADLLGRARSAGVLVQVVEPPSEPPTADAEPDDEFRSLVRRMRAAQKAYFQERRQGDLILSKRLESQVDAALDDERRPSLFDDEPTSDERAS